MASAVNKKGQRLDNRGRILRDGEIQRPDGRYMYSFVHEGTNERKYIYSWKLDKNDVMPKGKKPDKSLREKEQELQVKQFVGVSHNGGGLTVLELVERYIETKRNVKNTTRRGYNTVINHLKSDPFGKKRIDTVKYLDAKNWLINLQDEQGKGYSSICTIRGVLRPAFQLAVKSEYIFSNPFNFELKEVLISNSIKRQALSVRDEKRFLKFVREDEHFKQYYDGMFILFKTGMRISEFCGLTLQDIDLKNKKISINHQLLYGAGNKAYIENMTKTKAGMRELPISKDVAEAFERIIKSRKPPVKETVIDGVSGFIFLNSWGKPTQSYYWEKKFKYAVDKHNRIYKDELPENITPHVARHTYCSRMAASGINLATLKYLMGHEDIQTTINVYTHLNQADARKELERLESNGIEGTEGEELSENECKIIEFNKIG